MPDSDSVVQTVLDSLVRDGRELGLQVAAYLDGRLVIDAWAGLAGGHGAAALAVWRCCRSRGPGLLDGTAAWRRYGPARYLAGLALVGRVRATKCQRQLSVDRSSGNGGGGLVVLQLYPSQVQPVQEMAAGSKPTAADAWCFVSGEPQTIYAVLAGFTLNTIA